MSGSKHALYYIGTRRVLARAFGFKDIDWLSKPPLIPTIEGVEGEYDAFDRDHLVLKAKLVDGHGLMATMIDVDHASLRHEPFRAADTEVRKAFARILDFTRDCTDIVDAMLRSELLRYGDQLKEMADPLKEAEFCLDVATVVRCH